MAQLLSGAGLIQTLLQASADEAVQKVGEYVREDEYMSFPSKGLGSEKYADI